MNNIEEKVLDEINEYFGVSLRRAEGSEALIKRIIDIVQPPQPSDEEIERMAEKVLLKVVPDRYDAGLNYARYCIEGIRTGLSYNRSKEEWVSVEERLPDVNVEVLALVRYKGGKSRYIITYRTGQGDWDSFLSESITHWQLLPPTDLFTTKQKEG